MIAATPQTPGVVSGAPNLPANESSDINRDIDIGGLRLHAAIGGKGRPQADAALGLWTLGRGPSAAHLFASMIKLRRLAMTDESSFDRPVIVVANEGTVAIAVETDGLAKAPEDALSPIELWRTRLPSGRFSKPGPVAPTFFNCGKSKIVAVYFCDHPGVAHKPEDILPSKGAKSLHHKKDLRRIISEIGLNFRTLLLQISDDDLSRSSARLDGPNRKFSRVRPGNLGDNKTRRFRFSATTHLAPLHCHPCPLSLSAVYTSSEAYRFLHRHRILQRSCT